LPDAARVVTLQLRPLGLHNDCRIVERAIGESEKNAPCWKPECRNLRAEVCVLQGMMRRREAAVIITFDTRHAIDNI
tara:strand:- start:39 stop:269 length:231 start_codon:yes stop_codon:yes gene_type:complete